MGYKKCQHHRITMDGNQVMAEGNTGKLVTVFGGSGFVGRHVVRALAKRGYRIRVATRRPDLAFYLQPLGNVGQIHAVQANLRYRQSVGQAVEGADAVVNLVAILKESGQQRFDAIQAFGARAVAEAAHNQHANLVHISAIGSDPKSESSYAKTKFEGEKAVLRTLKDAVIIRPSIVFGSEDQFFNRFAKMTTLSLFLPLIGGGHTRFQPVFVGDLAEAIALAVDGKARLGATYEIGGPEILTFRECMEFLLKTIDRNRMLLSLPWWFASLIGRIGNYVPGVPITSDQVNMLRDDNVVSQSAILSDLTLDGLNIKAKTIEAIVPEYLGRFRPTGQFHRNRTA